MEVFCRNERGKIRHVSQRRRSSPHPESHLRRIPQSKLRGRRNGMRRRIRRTKGSAAEISSIGKVLGLS